MTYTTYWGLLKEGFDTEATVILIPQNFPLKDHCHSLCFLRILQIIHHCFSIMTCDWFNNRAMSALSLSLRLFFRMCVCKLSLNNA